MQQRMIQCPNCGTEFAPAPFGNGSNGPSTMYECPVCHFHVSAAPQAEKPARLSLDEWETRLSTLAAEALNNGLRLEDLVDVLRSELAFAAEMAHPGRRLSIQIIDLGPEETEIVQRPVHDPKATQQSRSLGQ